MMSTSHRQAILIRERSEIVWMRSFHDKANERAALLLWTKEARSR